MNCSQRGSGSGPCRFHLGLCILKRLRTATSCVRARSQRRAALLRRFICALIIIRATASPYGQYKVLLNQEETAATPSAIPLITFYDLSECRFDGLKYQEEGLKMES
jgi:hypothetical protein